MPRFISRGAIYVAVTIVFLLLIPLVGTPGAAASGDDHVVVSESSDVIFTSVTAYSGGFAVVKEVREVNLLEGTSILAIRGVPSRMDPDSVRAAFKGGGVQLIEQVFNYDLITPENLFRKYVGKKVKVYVEDPSSGRKVLKEALLLSYQGQPVFEIDGEVTFGVAGTVVFPELPEGLVTKPTLFLKVDSRKAGKEKLELFYETGGFSWRLNYSLFYRRGESSGMLDGWVTLDNRSGGDFRDASVTLVAGDVSREAGPAMRMAKGIYTTLKAPAREPAEPVESPLFEYHSYALPRNVSISGNESKRVLFLSGRNVNVEEEFVLEGQEYYYRGRYTETQKRLPVRVKLSFVNEKDRGPGVPLPAGKVKVFAGDLSGGVGFIGEARIPHTPVGERVVLDVGRSFDVVASRKQLEYERVGRNVSESVYLIELRNHRKNGVTVKVIEHLPGEWKVLRSSHPFEKLDSRRIQFNVPVPPGGTVELTYRVRVKY